MQKQKGISTLVGIIIIIVFALILFGGVFAYQYFATKFQQNSEFFVSSQKTNQTQTQTAGWKTYTNNKFGYQIEYPSDTTLFDAMGTTSIENTSNINFTPKLSSMFLQINVTSAELLSNPSYSYSQCPRKEYPYVKTTIAGLDFFKSDVSNDYKSMNNRNAVAIEYCIIGNNGNEYSLVVNAQVPSDTILKMMNTFKFTK